MKKLNPAAFDRARQFLKRQARPLDRALFKYRFEAGSTETVIGELSRFQNDDGGFGRALEPDLRTPSSSALATAIGLSILKEVKCTADHPLVSQAVRFLLETFAEQTRVWRIAPQDANDFPHAPWWHDVDGSLTKNFGYFKINPRADIIRLLHHFSAIVPPAWLNDLTEETVSYIELEDFGWIDLLNVLRLTELEALPEKFKDRLLPRVLDVTPKLVSRDPEEWKAHNAQPFWLAPSPQSPVAEILWDDLQLNLDYQIDHQTAEGTWEPGWSWGPFYPEVWEQARLEWRGHLTLNTLTSLRAFDRIAAISNY